MSTLTLRRQQLLATPSAPPHVLTALGLSGLAPLNRAGLDSLLNAWVAGTGGTIRTVTSSATWTTAMAAALPGDLIRITSSFTVSSGQLSARGNLYGISGTNLTASPAGGLPGLPIVITCADGAFVTGSGLTNNVGVLDIMNCRHVWSVGFNITGTTTFGIRSMNGGGTASSPAYIAYSNITGCRDATIAVQGWFQLISSSGGVAPAGAENTWGFSEHWIVEENDCIDPNPTEVAGNPGEGIYLGRGAAPGWISRAENCWVRGNRVTSYVANGIEVKPGCRRIWVLDNEIWLGRGQNGAPIELCYQFSGTDTRPAWMTDPEIWCEGNRIWDFNLSETGTTRNQCIIVGMAGCRVANNLVWSVRDSSGGTSNIAGILIQSEKTVSDFGDTSLYPTWIVNCLFWGCNAIANLGASNGAITGVIQRNNITASGYTGGQFTASAADFLGPVPAVGVLGTAAGPSGDPGTAFELLPTSSLWAAGVSIADLDLAVPYDPADQLIASEDLNPGPFQTSLPIVVGGEPPVSRFVAYTRAATPGPGQRLVVDTVVDLIDPTGRLLATTDRTRVGPGVARWRVAGAALQIDPDRTLSRTVTIQAASDQVSLVPTEPGDLLHPESGNRVKIAAGINDGQTWTLATLLIDAVEVEMAGDAVGYVSIELVDPGRPIRSQLVDPFPWSEGEKVEEVVARLLDIVVDEVDLAATGYTMPAAGSYPPGKVIADLVQNLLGGCGHELTADEDGRLYSRPVPPTKADDTEVWGYGGPGRLPVPRARRRWSVRSPQGVLVTGGSLLTPGTTYSVPVWDTDPDSQGYYRGPGEVQVEEVTYEHVASPNQSVVAGYARLRRVGTGPAIVEIDIAPNPAMQLGDLVDLKAPGLASSGLYRVRSIGVLPTQPDRLQQVQLRAIWDPEAAYVHPAIPVTPCVSSATDTFDRPDQNLEDLETSPGSPQWTELRYSWAVVGGKAIQRHNGTASPARWNTPLCGLDVIVYTTIGEIPTGKWAGPYARSSGEFDFYCAVVDPQGRIRIEMWQAGKKMAELGSYSTNTDPAGKQLDLMCEGDRITAVWEGTEVLSKVDTRRTGPYVGMFAIGGVQGSTAPSIGPFSAELLT